MIEIDPSDPTSGSLTKATCPVYAAPGRSPLSRRKKVGGSSLTGTMHRLRHAPQQERSFAVRRVQPLLERGALVSCSDAGGVPTIYPDETVLAGQRLAGTFDAVGSIDDAPVLLAGMAEGT